MRDDAGSNASTMLDAIGGTPLVRLRHVVPDDAADVFVKVEGGNPTGSYKDRMALAMIEGAERRGILRPGQRVVDISGGSTGSSLAFVCAMKGYPLSIVTSDAFAAEKLRTMRAFGAELTVVESEGGQITPDLFVRMRVELRRIVEREHAYWTDQFNNTDALIGYDDLGRELLAQMPPDTAIDAFCAAVGTAGMLVGVASHLRRHEPGTRVVALEPTSSPTLTSGAGGPHRVEGIATGIVPPLLSGMSDIEARTVDETRGRELALPLARREGIFAGTSSAVNVAGAIELARELGRGRAVVTVAADSGLKYLAGDLFRTSESLSCA